MRLQEVLCGLIDPVESELPVDFQHKNYFITDLDAIRVLVETKKKRIVSRDHQESREIIIKTNFEEEEITKKARSKEGEGHCFDYNCCFLYTIGVVMCQCWTVDTNPEICPF